MARGRHYEYQYIDRAKDTQDDWYLQRRKEIGEEDSDVQTKLEISQPGDAHEVEADSIAQNFVNGGNASISSVLPVSSSIQTKSESSSEFADSNFNSLLSQSKGAGQSLDNSTRGEMESKMGTDLSGVKIHTGSAAHAMSESINAKAFTHGQDVYFKNGNYDTNSHSGKELLAHEIVHTKQQTGDASGIVQRTMEDVDRAESAISKIIYKGFLGIRRLFKNPSAKRAIEAYHILASLTQEDILLFQATYPTLYGKIMDNLPVQFLELPTSGLVKGISGEEVPKLLERLYMDKTWQDPILLDVLVSLIVQAFGITVPVDVFGVDVFGPHVLLHDQNNLTLDQYLIGKYKEHNSNPDIAVVLKRYGFSDTGYAAKQIETPFSEYSMGRMAVGYYATAKGKHKGVVGSLIGLAKKPILEAFALNEFQDWMGGAMGGIQFSDPENDTEIETKKTGLLTFNADFKTGEAHVIAKHLPFDNVNYFGADYSFRSGPGTFDNLIADLDWASKKEKTDTMGSIHIEASDVVFNNLRIVFQNETYAIGKITVKGIKADVLQLLSRDELNGTYKLIFKALEVLMNASLLLTYAFKLIGNRFSAGTTPEGGNDLAGLLMSESLRAMGMKLGFDSLLLEHVLLVDRDYSDPERKTKGPKADTDYFERIELKKTEIDFYDKGGKAIRDAEEKIKKIVETARLDNNRALTDQEINEIKLLSIQQDLALEEYRLLVADKKELKKLKTDRAEIGLGKTKAKKLDQKIKDLEKKIAEQEGTGGIQTFHLRIYTEDILLTNPEMINTTLTSSLKDYSDKTEVDKFGSGTVTFETDLNQYGLSDTSLSFTEIDIPTLSAANIHYKTKDETFEIKGSSVRLEGVTGNVDIGVKDQSIDDRKQLFEFNQEIIRLQNKLRFKERDALTSDEQTDFDNDTAVLTKKKEERQTLLQKLDSQGNPLSFVDIKDMTVQRFEFVPTLIKTGKTSSIIIPSNNPPIELKVVKLEKFKLDFSKGTTLSANATVTANKLTIPEDYEFESIGSKSVFSGTAMTDIIAESISFKYVSDHEFHYGAGAISGTIGLEGKEGTKTPFIDLDVLLNRTSLTNGKYIKVDEFNDKVSFSITPIAVPQFKYEGEKIKVGATGPVTFTDVLVDVNLHYAPDALDNSKRDKMDLVTINEFDIDKITGTDLYVEKKNKQGSWEPLLTAPNQSEPFCLNKLKVKGLGFNLASGKITPIITPGTTITLGDQATQAFIMAQLGLQFDKMFKTDLTDIKVATIAFQGGDDKTGSKLVFTDIVIGDADIARLNFVSDEWNIKSSGKHAHLSSIKATVEIDFTPGKWDEIKSVQLKEMKIGKLTADGLELIKDPNKEERVTLVKIPPGETSSIENIWMKNFSLEFADGKFKELDYSKATAGTGKISIPAITSDYLKDLSSSLVVKAEGMTFTGKPQGAFDISVKKPKLGMHDASSQFSFLDSDGNRQTIKIFESHALDNFLEADELGVGVDAKGLMTFKLVNPLLKNLSFKYGNNIYEAEGKVQGTVTIKEGTGEFEGSELPAWLISADSDLVFEHINIYMFDQDQNSEVTIPRLPRTEINLPFEHLEKSMGTATIEVAGHRSAPITITEGQLNFRDIGEIGGNLMREVITDRLQLGPRALAFFDWVEDFSGVLDDITLQPVEPWIEDLFNRLDTGNPDTSRDALAAWVDETLTHGLRIGLHPGTMNLLDLVLRPLLVGRQGIPFARTETADKAASNIITQNVHVREIMDCIMHPPNIPQEDDNTVPIAWDPDAIDNLEEFFDSLLTDPIFTGTAGSPNGPAIQQAIVLWMVPALKHWFVQNLKFDFSLSGIDLEKEEGFKFKEPGGDVTVNVLDGSLKYIPITISDIPAFTYTRKNDEGKSTVVDVGGIHFDQTTYNDPGGIEKIIRNPKVTVKNFGLRIQKKSLSIGSTDDPLEHEADSIASKVASGQNADLTGVQRFFSGVQRKEQEEEAPLDLVDSLDSTTGGANMDESTLNEMESKMGVDFSGVKVHTDANAHSMNEQVNARAFTYGQNIFFRNGNYNPNSKAGKELLAHELVHTVQQSGNVQRKIQRTPQYKQGPNLQSIWFRDIPELESVYDGKSTFTIGAQGEHVKRIQQTLQELQWGGRWKNEAGNDFLVNLGPSGDDGIFGENTLHSLKAIQRKFLLAETGVVDQTTMKKFDGLFWNKTELPRSANAIKQKGAEEKATNTTETREQRYARLLKEYKEIIEKYGIQDMIRNYPLVELGMVERLLEQIKPKLLLDLYEPTEILPGAKRYDAWYGSARLVILDAQSIDEDHNHEVSLNVMNNEGGLKFITYRNAEADTAFDTYKKNNAATVVESKGAGITGEVGLITIPPETEQQQVAIAQKTRKVATNKEGHVIWNLPQLDVHHLAQEGVDASALKFVYEDRNEFEEGPATGGCRYLTYYHEAYIGVIDVQLSTYSEQHRTDDAYFTAAYTDPKSNGYSKVKDGTLFRIAYGEGSRTGDYDLIQIVGRYGFINHFGSPTTTENVFAFAFGAEGIPGTVGVEKMQMIPSAKSATRIGTSRPGFVSDDVVIPKQHPKDISKPKTQLPTENEIGGTGKANASSGNAVKTAEIFESLGNLKKPAIEVKSGEDIPLESGKQTRPFYSSEFENVINGTPDQAETRYIWTIDDSGINCALEKTPVGNNPIIKHTNLSSEAYAGGEVWFTGENSVFINPKSGRFGGKSLTPEQWNACIVAWKSLGYDVSASPLNP